MLIFIVVLSITLFVLLSFWFVYKSGKHRSQATRGEAINEAVRKAVSIRDRLQRDDSYAERVRKFFTRR